MKVNVGGRIRNLPDFLVVGTGKAGTTSLHHYFDAHPQVLVPSRVKETLFFQIVTNPNREQLAFNTKAITTFEEYLNQFDEAAEGQVCGEVCPSYMFFHDHTIPNIQLYHPRWEELKILFVLREPVDKVLSHYHFVTNTLGIEDSSLESALELEGSRTGRDDILADLLYVRGASYYKQVRAFVDVFPRVEVVFFEQMKRDLAGFMESIYDFLGVDRIPPDNNGHIHNRSSRRRIPKSTLSKWIRSGIRATVPPMIRGRISSRIRQSVLDRLFHSETISDETRARLKETFREDVRRLEQLIEKDLSFWGYS